MVLDCVRVAVDVYKVVVETFEVVLGGFRSFHILVRTDLYKLIIYQSLPQKTLFGAIYGTNWLTRSKLSFILSSGRCFTEVATYFKSYWKHWNWPPQRVQRLMFGALAPCQGVGQRTNHSDKGLTLKTSAFTLLYGGLFTFSTQLTTLNYPVIFSHQHSTTVSLETYPLYLRSRLNLTVNTF